MANTCPNCGRVNASLTTTCTVCGVSLVPSSGVGTGGYFLVAATGRRYHLSEHGETFVGSRGSAILLADPQVAHQHARLRPTGSGFILEDLAGGVRVNGHLLTGPILLQLSDTILIGATQLQYQSQAAALPPLVAQPAIRQTPAITPPHPAVPAAVLRRIPSPQPSSLPSVSTLPRGVIADGEVRHVAPDRQDQPPFDPVRLVLTLSVVALMFGVFVVVGTFACVFVFILVALSLVTSSRGQNSLLSLLIEPFLWPFRASIRGLRRERLVTILNLQLFDTFSHASVDVTLIRKAGSGGNIRLGDKARVWGKRDARTGQIRAYRIDVYESGGHPAHFALEGEKPLPVWVAILTVILTIISLVSLGTFYSTMFLS